MERAYAHLQSIHELIITVSPDRVTDIMEIAGRPAPLIGFPARAETPMLARTLAANLKNRDIRYLAAEIRFSD